MKTRFWLWLASKVDQDTWIATWFEVAVIRWLQSNMTPQLAKYATQITEVANEAGEDFDSELGVIWCPVTDNGLTGALLVVAVAALYHAHILQLDAEVGE